MSGQMQQWTEYLSCPICKCMFSDTDHRPISLACGHTICKMCLDRLKQKKCPFDAVVISHDINKLPVNLALLQLVGATIPETQEETSSDNLIENSWYTSCKRYIEELAIFLKADISDASPSSTALLSRPMQRKLVALVSCQLVEEEGRTRAMRAARSLGERAVTELIIQHQNQQQLSANLWAAVRARGCQFLGPAMQEEVLKLILLALEDGSALSRKVLVLFVVQRLAVQYPQASKTAIGHVVQLLYRASCFKVTKRHEESSLMQLKEEIRTYEALRHEHDAQIIQIATEAGLRISPEQWSSLLYGDTTHKSQMQSIIDKLQTPQSFSQSVQELIVMLRRIGDPGNLTRLEAHLELLSNIDISPESPAPSWENLEAVLKAVKTVVQGLVDYIQYCNLHKLESSAAQNTKYKTSLCRDFVQKGNCPRGSSCTFAHSKEELDRYRIRHRKPQKKALLDHVTKATSQQNQQTELTAVSKQMDVKDLAKDDSNLTGKHMTHEAGTQDLTWSSLADSKTVHPPSHACNFTVPVAKAMPMSHKGHHLKQMIYTSPTVGRAEPSPEVIPIAQRVNILPTKTLQSTNGRQMMNLNSMSRSGGVSAAAAANRGSGPFRVQAIGENQTAAISPTHALHMVRESDPPIPINAIQASAITVIQQRLRANTPSCQMSSNPLAAFRVDAKEQMTEAGEQMGLATTSRNPFTGDYYRRPLNSETYSQMNLEVSHLEVLHRRKNELIQQLSKTKHIISVPRTEMMNLSTNSMPDNTDKTSSIHSSNVTMSHMSFGSVMSSASQPYSSAVSSEVLDSPVMSQIPQSVIDSITMSRDNPSAGALPMMSDDVQVADDVHLPWSGVDFTSATSAVSDTTLDGKVNPYTESGFDIAHIVATQALELDSVGDSLEDDGEFIPFEEHATVSKYGPISRLSHVSRTRNTGPFQVTAAQPKRQVMPVTAVTPIQRPYPISVEVPSQFSSNSSQDHVITGHQKDPNGYGIAASLPTAFIQPSLLKAGLSSSLLVSGLPSESDALWNLKEKMLSMPVSSKPSSNSATEQAQICHELAELTRQIDHLEMSEHDRLSRELQAVKMKIQEAERQQEMTE